MFTASCSNKFQFYTSWVVSWVSIQEHPVKEKPIIGCPYCRLEFIAHNGLQEGEHSQEGMAVPQVPVLPLPGMPTTPSAEQVLYHSVGTLYCLASKASPIPILAL